MWHVSYGGVLVATSGGDDRRYLRPRDVQRITGLAKSTVMAALWSGQLRGYRMGKAWLIPVEAIDEWIEAAQHNCVA